MSVRLLKVLGWGFCYLLLLEVGLEIRAYTRGFDTILFGTFQRQDIGVKSIGAVSAQKEGGVPVPGAVDKKPDEVRYWIASSSHAEDSYLSRDLVFPSQFEKLLRASGVRATVINASHAGMDIGANLSDLETRGATLKPDVAILYQMSIQISEISKKLLSGHRPDRGKPKLAQESSTKPRPNWIVRTFEETSLYAQLKGNVSNRLTGQRVLADSLGGQGEREFEQLIRAFIRSARQIGAEPVLCTFATSHQRKQMPNIPGEVSGFMFRYNIYLSVDGWLDTLERFNAILKRLAAEEQLLLVDLDAEISGRSEYFRDFVHFTPAGHERVARALLARLALRNGTLSASMAATR
jgi:hypothetical protein